MDLGNPKNDFLSVSANIMVSSSNDEQDTSKIQFAKEVIS